VGKTSIEWTDASWNPIVGCTEISPGCANCYAARLAATRLKDLPEYNGLADKRRGEHHWLGEVRFFQSRLREPLHWRTPRRIFVCDMGDLFHEKVDTGWIRSVFEIIAQCPQHTFQILTKRADLMRVFMTTWAPAAARELPNVWLGVSVENQHFADERIPLLLQTPAAVRWISAEPLLGPVDLRREYYDELIDWVVCGGESGANARPMHPDWARSLRDQCQAASVPFFFKQWGNWGPHTYPGDDFVEKARGAVNWKEWPDGTWMHEWGKKIAGRLLDGSEWNEYPAKDTYPGPHRDEFPAVQP